MTDEKKKPREFWIKSKPSGVARVYDCEQENGQPDLSPHYTKFIEKSAYDAAINERDEWREWAKRLRLYSHHYENCQKYQMRESNHDFECTCYLKGFDEWKEKRK